MVVFTVPSIGELASLTAEEKLEGEFVDGLGLEGKAMLVASSEARL